MAILTLEIDIGICSIFGNGFNICFFFIICINIYNRFWNIYFDSVSSIGNQLRISQ